MSKLDLREVLSIAGLPSKPEYSPVEASTILATEPRNLPKWAKAGYLEVVYRPLRPPSPPRIHSVPAESLARFLERAYLVDDQRRVGRPSPNATAAVKEAASKKGLVLKARYSKEEAAQLLGIYPSQLYRLVLSGYLPGVVYPSPIQGSLQFVLSRDLGSFLVELQASFDRALAERGVQQQPEFNAIEAGEILGVSLRTVRKYVRTNQLEGRWEHSTNGRVKSAFIGERPLRRFMADQALWHLCKKEISNGR